MFRRSLAGRNHEERTVLWKRISELYGREAMAEGHHKTYVVLGVTIARCVVLRCGVRQPVTQDTKRVLGSIYLTYKCEIPSRSWTRS